ncbi:uracil-DNA glycosylase [Lacticaseibacillus parakribbianus]|uniref:uracil-DNA glycosylase n=1 Tax=Lacticaseibacillus parakribbianus TaxID=2970927 RepID=UPI0021CAF19D|nr:uracil-DNA glycosylase [Lacticaseibacillus parakribbianus]
MTALFPACSEAALAQAAAQVFPATQGFVPGRGPQQPRLILVGEAPGETEVASGRPFTGRAGAKLDLMLAALGLTRADVFITMTFHRRPVRLKGAKLVNRPPTKAEMLADPLLDWDLAALPEPPVLLMGNTALWRLYHGRVSDWHGRVLTASLSRIVDGQLVAGPVRRFGVVAHPAALLYRTQTQTETLADLVALRQPLLEATL